MTTSNFDFVPTRLAANKEVEGMRSMHTAFLSEDRREAVWHTGTGKVVRDLTREIIAGVPDRCQRGLIASMDP